MAKLLGSRITTILGIFCAIGGTFLIIFDYVSLEPLDEISYSAYFFVGGGFLAILLRFVLIDGIAKLLMVYRKRKIEKNLGDLK